MASTNKDKLKELLGKIAVSTNTITVEDDINHYTILELLNALRSNVKELNDIVNRLDDSEIYVSYEDFGAKGDGITDDGKAIKDAHIFANENGVSIVCNRNAKYLIKNTKNIPVKTNTDLNGATIIIDENYVSKEPIYILETEKSNLTARELEFLQTSVNVNIQRFESVTSLNGYVVVVEDPNTVICNRELGGSVEEQTYKEVFAVDVSGSIQCINYDSPYNYGALISKGTKYKIPSSYITFKNANFVLTGSSTSTYKSYHRYILIERSLVNFENIHVSVQNDSGNIQRMFFRNQNTYNVTFKNIDGCDFANNTDYSSSTYLFSNMNTVAAKYENINTPVYNPHYWGCFQSFYSKNLVLRDSNISRYDAHFYGADILIDNCQFGYKSIQIQGHGQLAITNTCVYSYTFINFRDDYGASWDGNISIENCKLVFKNIGTGTDGSIIRHTNTSDFDYGYNVKIPNIFIKNFTFVQTSKLENCIAINLLNKTGMTGNRHIVMPDKIVVDNIISQSRLKIINVIGDYIQYRKTNITVKDCRDTFRAISLYLSSSAFVSINSINNPENAYSPNIVIDNCDNVSFSCKNASGSLIIQNSVINRINTNETSGGALLDYVKIINCNLNPNCSANPTSGVPINKFNSNNTYLHDVYCEQISVNGSYISNTSFINYIGFFTSDYADIAFNTLRVKFNHSIAGYSLLEATLLNKLLNNLTI